MKHKISDILSNRNMINCVKELCMERGSTCSCIFNTDKKSSKKDPNETKLPTTYLVIFKDQNYLISIQIYAKKNFF